ncbi:sulfurtransferase TusA family protein [Calderihabitans maritimus]|uniref:UPF0033 domain-containing protein n=1 Tax=Calderihabitans maritimus TaxID=1246530 RepID=A0A1Z5HPK1_9FIRM|nr:sulfurtransferase TusA family protein [Calderihabitans maritimus]GAW91225.1 hypothetical protein STH105 [Calderihabitans maritimus]
MATVKLSVLGEMCPLPIIKAEAKFKQMREKDTLIIETDHSCAPRFIVERMRNYRCTIEVKEVAFGIWHVIITKGV